MSWELPSKATVLLGMRRTFDVRTETLPPVFLTYSVYRFLLTRGLTTGGGLGPLTNYVDPVNTPNMSIS